MKITWSQNFSSHQKIVRNDVSRYILIKKDNDKRRKQLRFNEKCNRACDNGKYDNDHKIYASMARMSSDDEHESKEYGDS